jgi:hypothetical protein
MFNFVPQIVCESICGVFICYCKGSYGLLSSSQVKSHPTYAMKGFLGLKLKGLVTSSQVILHIHLMMSKDK